MLQNKFSQFRIISLIEGFSYLILLFIAMPLKYFAGLPIAVKIVGMTHGILFILFCVTLLLAKNEYKWSFSLAIKLFVYSLIPFGFIAIEKIIMKKQTEEVKY